MVRVRVSANIRLENVPKILSLSNLEVCHAHKLTVTTLNSAVSERSNSYLVVIPYFR